MDLQTRPRRQLAALSYSADLTLSPFRLAADNAGKTTW
jgi:hypothetical protein